MGGRAGGRRSRPPDEMGEGNAAVLGTLVQRSGSAPLRRRRRARRAGALDDGPSRIDRTRADRAHRGRGLRARGAVPCRSLRPAGDAQRPQPRQRDPAGARLRGPLRGDHRTVRRRHRPPRRSPLDVRSGEPRCPSRPGRAGGPGRRGGSQPGTRGRLRQARQRDRPPHPSRRFRRARSGWRARPAARSRGPAVRADHARGGRRRAGKRSAARGGATTSSGRRGQRRSAREGSRAPAHRFAERVLRRVPLSLLRPTDLAIGDGLTSPVRAAAKRLFDLFMSSVLLVCAAPLLALLAVLLKLESQGPVFYSQERTGRGGKPYKVHKLRTMRKDAETLSGPVWASQRDPRVTRIGAMLRKTRLDEIPQVFAVFRGDMSFVGPRPERPFFVNQLKAQIPFFGLREAMKPGITGWAQIRYPYGSSVEDAKNKLEYDLYYALHQSLFLDLCICFHTAKTVLFGRGAR